MYVLISRVTDPANFALVGLPPFDLLEDLARALAREGTGYRSGLRKGSHLKFRIHLRPVPDRSVPCRRQFGQFESPTARGVADGIEDGGAARRLVRSGRGDAESSCFPVAGGGQVEL